MGVKAIAAFSSSRSIPLLGKIKELKRCNRWERIAIEASKQCGRGVIPKIFPITDYPKVLTLPNNNTLKLILWEREGKGPKEVFKNLKGIERVFFIVGPEGGFNEKEIEEAIDVGYIPINLGERVLRAETAGLCLLSILQYEWGDIGREKN